MFKIYDMFLSLWRLTIKSILDYFIINTYYLSEKSVKDCEINIDGYNNADSVRICELYCVNIVPSKYIIIRLLLYKVSLKFQKQLSKHRFRHCSLAGAF